MPPDPPEDVELDRFAEAVVQELWNELGRQRITSLRELARRAGMTHTSVIVRMNGDARTGKRVPINVRDLYAFGVALGLDPGVFVNRAQDAVNRGDFGALPSFTTQSQRTGRASSEERGRLAGLDLPKVKDEGPHAEDTDTGGEADTEEGSA